MGGVYWEDPHHCPGALHQDQHAAILVQGEADLLALVHSVLLQVENSYGVMSLEDTACNYTDSQHEKIFSSSSFDILVRPLSRG